MKKPRIKLIAIAGGSGSGKTSLADDLARRLGPHVGRISIDDYYLDRSHLSLRQREKVNFDHPRSIEWELLTEHLEKLKKGKTIETPTYDYGGHVRLDKTRPIKPSQFVLVDGLWPFRSRAMSLLFDLKVYVRCPMKERLARRLRRDQADRGRSARSIEQQYKAHVLPMHDRFVAPQKNRADLSVQSPVSRADMELLVDTIRWLE